MQLDSLPCDFGLPDRLEKPARLVAEKRPDVSMSLVARRVACERIAAGTAASTGENFAN
jgi:hypothetical protein